MTGRCTSDRGASLVDLVIGLALTTLMAGAIAGLMTATASRDPGTTTETDFALVADRFARDVRESSTVAIERRERAESVTLGREDDDVVWTLDRDGLSRREGSGSPRAMVTDVDLPASGFALADGDGSPIDAGDAEAVRWCTRLVRLTITSPDGTIDRQAALRMVPAPERCP